MSSTVQQQRIYPVYFDVEDHDHGGTSSREERILYGGSSAARDEIDSTAMVRALAQVLPGFYAVYYAIAGILSAAFRTPFTGFEPFDHYEFSPAVAFEDTVDVTGWRSLVTWLSMMVTMNIAGPWLVYLGARDSSRAVEVATAAQMIHFFTTVCAMNSLPQNSIWWATFMPSCVFMGRSAELVLASYGFKHPLRRRLGVRRAR